MPVIHKLSKPLNINEIIDTIQQKMINLNNKFQISWIKAHLSIYGNQDASILAKHTTLNSYNHIEKTMTTLKRLLTEASNNAMTVQVGLREYRLADTQILPQICYANMCKLETYIYSGYHYFSSYLHKFALDLQPSTRIRAKTTFKHYLIICPT